MNDVGWKIIKGKRPVLLVAAHNYPQIRNNNIKMSDIGTGELVEELCRENNCWGIISTRIQDDPNWYLHSPFRRKIKEIIKTENIVFVIDIHGSREDVLDLIKSFPNREDVPTIGTVGQFKDNEQLTLGEDLAKDGVDCVQIEIRKDGRVEGINEESFRRVREELKKLI